MKSLSDTPTLSYKGFTGSVKAEEDYFCGRIENIRDIVGYWAKTQDGLQKSFEEAVDDYLDSAKDFPMNITAPFPGMNDKWSSEAVERLDKALRKILGELDSDNQPM